MYTYSIIYIAQVSSPAPIVLANSATVQLQLQCAQCCSTAAVAVL